MKMWLYIVFAFSSCGCVLISVFIRSCLEAAVVVVEGVGEEDSREGPLLPEPRPQWDSHSPIYKQCRAKRMHCTLYGCIVTW